jgi:arsenate reductase
VTPARPPELARKAFAELLGSMLLAATVVGSGIAAQRLSPDDVGLQLLENALITGAVLVALILALGPVSAAFNPVVTLAERALGAIGTAAAAALIAAQVVGCSVGVVLANLMFDLDPVTLSTRDRAAGGLWLGEVVATFGLLVVIFGVVRSGRGSQVGYAVGGYITAAYWFTSSTSFANPAITVARSLTDTFAGIAPGSVAGFVLMQLLGGALAVGAVLLLYPNARELAGQVATAGTSTTPTPPLAPAPSPATQEA